MRGYQQELFDVWTHRRTGETIPNGVDDAEARRARARAEEQAQQRREADWRREQERAREEERQREQARERFWEQFRERSRQRQQQQTAGSGSPWDILGVQQGATAAEIRKAWVILMKANHPDVGGDVKKAQAVNAAYEALKKRNWR
jgi:hypothetical protein